MKKRLGLFCGIVIIYFLGVLTGYALNGCSELESMEESSALEKAEIKSSIFSWNGDYIYLEYADQIAEVMEYLNCDTIYQEISKADLEEDVIAFLKRQARMGNKVWYLAGKKHWALEKNAETMRSEVEEVVEWNQLAGAEHGFQGIVWDVEPYLLDEWDEDAAACMKQYVENCKVTYEIAKEHNLQVLLCIPYHYDNHGMEQELEELIAAGCDGVAVMNYNKEDEARQIATELALVKKYDKQLIHITELQEPGKHGLEEYNTYYYDGFEAVKKSWKKLEESCEYDKLGFSWHYLKTAMELMEEE